MRGFGVVQACFAHEGQMDKLAAAVGTDPVSIRLLNAMETGDLLITGQPVESVAPVARLIRETNEIPLPVDLPSDANELDLPGGSGITAERRHIKRGVGWGVSIKNIMYSEGFDDYSTAKCTLSDGKVVLKFATSEVGQGFVTLAPQIARSVLGVTEAVCDTIDTQIGSAGSTSASRQTWMSGGAVDGACRLVRERLFEHVGALNNIDPIRFAIEDDEIVDTAGTFRMSVIEASTGITLSETYEHHHRATEELDENGQGNCHVAFAFVAHRAVVDVDPELGLVKVVQIATAQDVEGKVRSPSFTDYLLPTALDAPVVVARMIEEYEPQAPLGAKGVGEPPCISVTPAIVAAIRDAIGRDIDRCPVRPQDICL